MAIPTQYQIIHPPVQNAMGSAHLHTPPSIFQHMMGQQNVPHQSSAPWPQMPQVPPMMMPWSIPSLQQSQLVRFTGEKPQATFVHGKPLHKRKLQWLDTPESLRAKQFITEEKMAAHFQDMHISSNYKESTTASSATMNEPQPCCSSSSDEIPLDLDLDSDPAGLENGKSSHPRLVISEELKRLQQEPMLPGSLLAKLESRPSMALVLWEPPSKHLRMLSNRQNIRQFTSSSNSISSNNNEDETSSNNDSMMNNDGSANNNHENIPDMNETIVEEQNDIELEPMDL